LTIHGRNDRNAPYGSGREWAFYLANARLVTVENAAHLPWIERPEILSAAITTFLDGKWPKTAEVVKKIE
jgi:pimeloyl-ACP methyl ester carboxylesterase